MADSCKNCRFAKATVMANNQMVTVCKRYPPSVQVVPVQTAQGVQMGMQSHYPPVNDGEWCGEYQAGIKLVN